MSKKKKKQKYKKKKVAKPELLKPILSETEKIEKELLAKVNKKKNKKDRKKKEKVDKKNKKPEKIKKEKKPLFKFLKNTEKSKEVKKSKKEDAKNPDIKAEKTVASEPIKPPFKQRLKENIKKKFAKDLRKPIIVIFTLAGILFILFLASVLTTFELSNKSMPGTRIGGMDLSFMTIDEIQNKLMEKGQPFLENKIKVTMDGQTQELSPRELGIGLDTRGTISDVEFISFGKTNVIDLISGLIKPDNIEYAVSIDIGTAVKNIEAKFNFAEKKSANAYLAFEEDVLKVVPEKSGKTIDLRTLYLSLKKNAGLLSLAPITVDLLDDTPLVTQAKLEEQLDSIKELLKNKIFLSYENYSYSVKLIDHIDWVKFDYRDTFKIGDKFSMPIELHDGEAGSLKEPFAVERKLWISVAEGPFVAWVDEEISGELESEPQDVEISKDENGEIVFNGRGENGKKIMKPLLIAALAEAINNQIEEVTIPVQEKFANVKTSEELQEMGIKTLIATGKSAFAGSPTNRIHNINVGISKYNGVIIEPGETFSFNDQLGPVDASTGYRTELVIKAEGTIPEYGGGLCQVSSTMYRAAIFAGLPIVERAPHSYAVSYYAQILGYGMDSTIYPGVHDLRFTNDTPGHILVQSYTDGTQAFYKFYGTDDGRRVKLEGPYNYGYHSASGPILVETPGMAPGTRRQVENAHTGFNSTWYRYITKNGETIKETIESAYRAMPAKILVGPAAAAPAEEAPAQ